MEAYHNGTPMIASSGYMAQVDTDLCAGCGECADVCQFAAISLDGVACINETACMGCGVCVAHCPQEAIELVREPAKGEPLGLKEAAGCVKTHVIQFAVQVRERLSQTKR